MFLVGEFKLITCVELVARDGTQVVPQKSVVCGAAATGDDGTKFVMSFVDFS